jgi:hypothetical protein
MHDRLIGTQWNLRESWKSVRKPLSSPSQKQVPSTIIFRLRQNISEVSNPTLFIVTIKTTYNHLPSPIDHWHPHNRIQFLQSPCTCYHQA